MWTWVPLFLVASFAAAGLTDPAGASLAAFVVVGVGGVGCVVAGAIADRVGRTTTTIAAMADLGDLRGPGRPRCSVRRARARRSSLAIVWGSSVIADSAQFSAAVSELAPPGTAGSALSVQTAGGFVLTGDHDPRSSALLDPTDAAGWRLAFGMLALGPVVGIMAMWRLRGRPEAIADGQRAPMTTWVDALEPGAPDIVAIWRSIEEEALMPLRREVRRRAGPGTAHGITVQLATLADALTTIVDTLDGDDLRRPGGEEDWNVAQTLGHTADARAGLSLAASRAAAGTFPPDAPGRRARRPRSRRCRARRAPSPDRPEPAHHRALGAGGAAGHERQIPVRSTIRSSDACAAASGWCSRACTTSCISNNCIGWWVRCAHEPLPTGSDRLLGVPGRDDRPRRPAPGDPADPSVARTHPAGPVAMRVRVARGGRAGHRRRAP